MLNNQMIVTKDVNRKVAKEYFFITGKLKFDCNYYIEKIKKACSSDDNMNYKTNIKSLMTPFSFFEQDKNFQKLLYPIVDHIDLHYDLHKFGLHQAWGFEVKPREKTLYHNHSSGALWSGVIYLNSSNQTLNFPEIHERVKPEEGVFAVFSSFLEHGCEKNPDNFSKFGMSFNCNEVKSW